MVKKRKKLDQFLNSRKKTQEVVLNEQTDLSNRIFRYCVGLVVVIFLLVVVRPEAFGSLERWADDVPIVVVTRERRGARVHHEDAWHEIDAFPADEVDPTGAGDVFSAAFLVHYSEAADVGKATRFASAAAACSVEAQGIEGIAERVVRI